MTSKCLSWYWRLAAGINLEDSPLPTRAAGPDELVRGYQAKRSLIAYGH